MKLPIIILLTIVFSYAVCLTDDDFYSVQLLELGKKLIYVSKGFKTNWYGAMDFCNSLGLRLMTINSAEENYLLDDFIKNYTPKIGAIWTSGNDLAKEGDWVWGSSGKKFQYSNWTSPQPDNDILAGKCESENCLEVGHEFDSYVSLIGLYWNDAKCSKKMLFICEQLR